MPEATFVYTVDYGSNGDGSYLSPMSVKTLEDVIALVNSQPKGEYILGYCGADLPDEGMIGADGLRWKNEIADKQLRQGVRRFPILAPTSIGEAKNTKAVLDAADIKPTRIILYCEWWHSWRVGLIWRHVFTGCKIEVRTMRWIGGEDYIVPEIRKERTWALYNLVGLFITILWVLGIEGVANIRRPKQAR